MIDAGQSNVIEVNDLTHANTPWTLFVYITWVQTIYTLKIWMEFYDVICVDYCKCASLEKVSISMI